MEERLKALETAIKLEEDGKEFYIKASEKSTQPFSKDMFKSLAEAEDNHIQKAKEIYKKLKSDGEWPKLVTSSKDEVEVKSVFPKDLKMTKEELTETTYVLNIGIEMEEKSIKYYDELAEKAVDPFEKRYYIALSREERGHYLDLSDYKEYFSDPAGWFGVREGFRLDG
ncbi:MAG: ferritin family protein [Halobacteriota archaeon]|nr:ferritin family protein [Halobacteriota archaeon]